MRTIEPTSESERDERRVCGQLLQPTTAMVSGGEVVDGSDQEEAQQRTRSLAGKPLAIQDMDAEVHAGATGRSALQQLYRRAWSFSDWINVSMASMTTHHWTTSTKGHRTFAVFRAHEASTQKGLPSKSTT